MRAPKVMYLAACLLTESDFVKVDNVEEFLNQKFSIDQFTSMKALRKANPEGYAYAIKTNRLLQNAVFEKFFGSNGRSL